MSNGGSTVGADVRLAELLVGLSGVADMGMGLPVGSAARVAVVAVELARGAGLGEADVAAVYYAALLQHTGCTAYSHEVSALFADEHAIKVEGLATDFTRPREVVFGYLAHITAAADRGERLRTLRSALLHSRSMTRGYQRANCETAALVAERLGCESRPGTACWTSSSGGTAVAARAGSVGTRSRSSRGS